MKRNRISQTIMDLKGELSDLEWLSAIRDYFSTRDAYIVFYTGTTNDDFDVPPSGGGRLLSFYLEPGDFNVYEVDNWHGIHNWQTIGPMVAENSGSPSVIRIEDENGKAWFEWNIGSSFLGFEVFDFTAAYPWDFTVVSGETYRMPALAIGWGFFD